MDYKRIKQQLYQLCIEYVQKRLHTIKTAMNAAQEAANNETRSTAGDKYDTSRSMMHLEQEKLTKQHSEAMQLKLTIERISPDKQYNTITSGSLAITSAGSFYLSISAGKLKIDGQDFYAVSPAAPLAQALLGLKKGDEGVFNGKKISILEII